MTREDWFQVEQTVDTNSPDLFLQKLTNMADAMWHLNYWTFTDSWAMTGYYDHANFPMVSIYNHHSPHLNIPTSRWIGSVLVRFEVLGWQEAMMCDEFTV